MFVSRIVLPGAFITAIGLCILLFNLSGLISYPPVDLTAGPPPDGQNGSLEITNNNPSNDTGGTENQLTNTECLLNSKFPSQILEWCGVITHYAQKRNLDPNLVAAVVWLESGGNPKAYSRSGAVGLMQVMPSDGIAASFMCANGPCFSNRPTSEQLYDPEANVSYGTKYLSSLVTRYGDVREALRAYGPMDAGYSYADKVLGLYQTYGN